MGPLDLVEDESYITMEEVLRLQRRLMEEDSRWLWRIEGDWTYPVEYRRPSVPKGRAITLSGEVPK